MDEGAAFLVEAAQHAVAPDHDIDLAAEAMEDTGELDRDVAAADDRDVLGHAAADHAGAADPVVLANADPRAVAGGDPRGPHAAGAGAHDEQVVVECHDSIPENKTSTRPQFRPGADYIGA